MSKTIKNTTGRWTMNGKLVSVPENYNISDYFRADGTYLGPDIHGVEPEFRDVASNGTLHNLRTGDVIRPATADEAKASREAAGRDGGVGAIEVGGFTCYVAE